MGDLELLSEIQLNDGTGLVNRQPRRNSVTRLLIGPLSRRTYCARVNGRTSDMTVAVYQGQNAEEVSVSPNPTPDIHRRCTGMAARRQQIFWFAVSCIGDSC